MSVQIYHQKLHQQNKHLSNFHNHIPICGPLTDKEKELEAAIPDISQLDELVNNYKWHHVVEQIWNHVGRCNKYVNDTEPWKQTNNPERLGTILYTLVEHLRIISILVWPIIPASAEKIAAQLGQTIGKLKDAKFKKDFYSAENLRAISER